MCTPLQPVGTAANAYARLEGCVWGGGREAVRLEWSAAVRRVGVTGKQRARVCLCRGVPLPPFEFEATSSGDQRRTYV